MITTTDQSVTSGSLTVEEAEIVESLDNRLSAYVEQPGGLIPALQETQNLLGYLPEAALMKISRMFDKTYSEVAGVVGFYSYFSTVPRGRYVVRVCLGTACYVRGGKEVLDAVRGELGIDVGGTTSDRLFSLEIGRCFGACGLAPVLLVNDDVHQRVKPARIGEIIRQYVAAGQETETLNEDV